MVDLEPAAAVFAVVGIVMLAAALLPILISRAPLSVPMVFFAAGLLAWTVFPQLPSPDPTDNGDFALHLTEVTVIVSLMGAGLALNRPFGWGTWSSTWRLLAITMPLSMLAVGFLGWAALGFGVASALLMAAALAPTDPVLASEVQVGEPDENPEADDEARFALTSEAGLNDGLAFPFTLAAVAISFSGVAPVGVSADCSSPRGRGGWDWLSGVTASWPWRPPSLPTGPPNLPRVTDSSLCSCARAPCGQWSANTVTTWYFTTSWCRSNDS